MAVYTRISSEELHDKLKDYGLRLHGNPTGVTEGIENTTYFFTAIAPDGATGNYVLTILESCSAEQSRFAAHLTAHLNRASLPVPCPLVSQAGDSYLNIAGKTALIFPRIQGNHIRRPGEEACTAIGNFLARAHLTGQALDISLANTRGLPWLQGNRETLFGMLDTTDQALLDEEIASWEQVLTRFANIPKGAIHGDLFHDNALFQDGRLVAVIDFFNACTDWLLLDVAIVVNDWCRGLNKAINANLAATLLTAYAAIRPFTREEHQAWQAILKIAACRFWASRLLAKKHQGEAKNKAPQEYRSLLFELRHQCPPLPAD